MSVVRLAPVPVVALGPMALAPPGAAAARPVTASLPRPQGWPAVTVVPVVPVVMPRVRLRLVMVVPVAWVGMVSTV